MVEQFFGILLALSFSVAYLPQIIRIIKTKSSKDISVVMLAINAVGYISGLMYIILCQSRAYWLWINYSLGLTMTIICIVFYALNCKG